MDKVLLPEQQLLEVINAALAKSWGHKDCYCEVRRLRRINIPERNWEIDVFGTGGTTLLYTAECDALRQRVLEKLAPEYDVLWSE